jgi:hypothetical protein
MIPNLCRAGCAVLLVVIAVGVADAQDAQDAKEGFEVHDKRRPQPQAVTPPTPSSQDQAGTPPSDAVVLFDGRDLSKWTSAKSEGEPAPWKVVDGVIESVPKTGNLQSKDQFADGQYHIEWMELEGTTGKSQGRGNSGIFIMGLYELQVLDNYQAETYADGMAGSIYGQYPPLANATRPQGQWQSYDVIFHAPKYEDGKVVMPANETVFLNGVLVQDHVKLIGPTKHRELTTYPTEHPAKAPIQLQDHGNPVRFRNIWVRPIAPKSDQPKPPVKSAGENYYDKH